MKQQRYGGFLKWWYQTTMGFPTKNDHLGVFWVPPFKETPIFPKRKHDLLHIETSMNILQIYICVFDWKGWRFIGHEMHSMAVKNR